MSDKTYIELCKNDKREIQISSWTGTGLQFIPSAAFYEIKGSKKDNVVVSRSQASISGNNIYTKITTAVTASAAEYDMYWEIHKDDGTTTNHCTKLLVLETC
jgi:hypothetical protein